MKMTKGVSLEDLFLDTEYMQTVVIILTTAQEKEFLDTYRTFGEKDQPSAILPNSARKLFADAEGYLIYSVVVLKKFIPTLQNICRDNRYTLRFFDVKEVDAKKEDNEEFQLIQYEAEEKKIKVRMEGRSDV